MDTSLYEQILSEMNDELQAFSGLSASLSGYEYEKRFRIITDRYNQKLFQASQGPVPKSKNEKNIVQTTFGKVAIKKKGTR